MTRPGGPYGALHDSTPTPMHRRYMLDILGKPLLDALGEAIWKRGVDVEILLCNPGSVPGGAKGALAAAYGNGWTCVDVAAEVIKAMDMRTLKTVAPMAYVTPDAFVGGAYVTYRYTGGMRFRLEQVHAAGSDRAGFPPRSMVSAVYFD